MHLLQKAGVLATLAGLLFVVIGLQYEPVPGVPVTSGPGYDDQAVLLSVGDRLLLVFERLEETQNDLYLTTSEDAGATWSDLSPISTGDADDLLGSIVELTDGTLALFYSSNDDGLYRIHRATSPDGSTWTKHGPVDLHQSPASPINPHVLVEDDGQLTMVYQLLTGNLYVAQSADGGVTWDELPTRIGPVGATSPRIAHTNDGRYLLTYHTGSVTQSLYGQLSDDPYTWSDDPIPLSVGFDSRDGFPLLLNDGTLAVFYVLAREDAPANVYYRASEDGAVWDSPVQATLADVGVAKPYAVPSSSSRGVYLVWAQEPTLDGDFDVYFQSDLEVRPLPTPTWTPGPPTATPTFTVLLTATPTTTWTAVPTRTLSPTPSQTSTQTPTPTATVLTATPTVTPTATGTPTMVPRLRLIPGSYPSHVSAGEPITITWTVQTNHGANTWIEWGTQSGEYDQRHDFPWIPGGIYDFEYTIIAPEQPDVYFRVTAADDVQQPVFWPGHVEITVYRVMYMPLIRR